MILRYFTKDEINRVSFGCDDGYERMSVKALIKYDELRHAAGFAMRPTCAFRTREHDISKKRSGNSKHCLGIAMDFHFNSMSQAIIIAIKAHEMGFNGIAIDEELRFIHLDLREDELTTWDY